MQLKFYIFALLYFCAGIFFAQERDTLITRSNGGLKHSHRMEERDCPRPKIEPDTFTIYEFMVIPNDKGIGPDPAEQGYIPSEKHSTQFRHNLKRGR